MADLWDEEDAKAMAAGQGRCARRVGTSDWPTLLAQVGVA